MMFRARVNSQYSPKFECAKHRREGRAVKKLQRVMHDAIFFRPILRFMSRRRYDMVG